MLRRVMFDLAGLLIVATRSRASLAAENLFLRKQLALFQERQAKPHRAELLERSSAPWDSRIGFRTMPTVIWHVR